MAFPKSEQDILNGAYNSAAAAFSVSAPGAVLTLAASEERTESANGDAVANTGGYRRFVWMLDVTAAATAAGDTLDVFVDVSFDNVAWTNAVHFTQVVGNGGAKRYYAVLDATTPGTSVVDATSDAAAGAVRPALSGPYFRARWAVNDATTDDAAFTFSVTGFAQ